MSGYGTPWASADAATRPRLHATLRCDVAVVGAGLTGLAAAVELLELDPDLDVVLVEADHVAAGASGRGTGLLGPRVGPPTARARRRYGDDVARAAYLWSADAVRYVTELVQRHGISCDLVPGTQLVVAPDERAAAEQRLEAEAARALGLPIAEVGPDELPRFAARCAGGLRYGPAATLDPAALTEELARLGERRGLRIFERSPVRRLRRGLLTTVVTDDGEVTADDVVVAAGAFGPDLGLPSGAVAVRVQAGLTQKLPPAAVEALSGLRTEPLIEHGELSPYFRLTPDGRLVVGGGAVRRGPAGSRAFAPGRLAAAVRSLSPTLADVDLESTWAGPVTMTRDGLPVLGRHPDEPRLHLAGGCNGHGLAISVRHGAQLARWIVQGPGGDLSFLLPWVRPKAPWVPRGRVTDWVLDRYLARLTAAAAPDPAPGAAPDAGQAGRRIDA